MKQKKTNCEDATCYYTLFTVYLCSGENVICDLRNVSNRQSRTIKGTHILKRKTFKCVLVLAQKHNYDSLLCCKAVHWDETGCQLQIEGKKNKNSVRESMFKVSPKGFCLYLNYPESEPFNWSTTHSIFLFYTKTSFLLHLFLRLLIIFCL